MMVAYLQVMKDERSLSLSWCRVYEPASSLLKDYILIQFNYIFTLLN